MTGTEEVLFSSMIPEIKGKDLTCLGTLPLGPNFPKTNINIKCPIIKLEIENPLDFISYK